MTRLMTIFQTILAAIAAPAATHLSQSNLHHVERCTAYNSSCWPSDAEWSSFNSSINGQLIRSHPSAAVCHTALYDADQCATAMANWTNSFWRTAQPGGYTAILWEMGEQTCSINGSVSDPCGQGRGM
jgi:hypothetical protein